MTSEQEIIADQPDAITLVVRSARATIPMIVNRMAELQILDDPKQWLAVVKLRNELVHEYPLGSSERYDRFTAAFDALPFLFDAAERAQCVVAERNLLDTNV